MSDMQIAVEPLFATPLVIDAPSPATVNGDLIAQLVPGRWIERGWDTALDPLVLAVLALADRTTGSAEGSQHAICWRATVAIHRIAAGAAFTPEPAYDAFWTAIYAPDAAAEVVFHDPRLPMPMMEVPDVRLRLGSAPDAPLYSPEIAARLQRGQVWMVPAWLRMECRTADDRRAAQTMVSVRLVAPLVRESA